MTIRFTARSGGAEELPDEDYGSLSAGVSENADGSGRVLIFQSPLDSPDEQNIALGLDTYCLSNETGGTHYGGVLEVGLTESVLRVVLDPDAASNLRMPDVEIEVAVHELDLAARTALRDGLRRVLSYGREDARPQLEGI